MPLQTLLPFPNIRIRVLSFLVIYLILLSPLDYVTAIQPLPPSPAEAPSSAHMGGSVYVKHKPPAPAKFGSHAPLTSAPAPAPAPAPERAGPHEGAAEVPELAPENERSGNGDEVTDISPSSQVAEKTVRWCAVREEHEACVNFIQVVKQFMGYSWKCVKKDTAQECMDSTKRGEADLVNLEAGLAYIALINYSMKAIANEIYCDQTKGYDAVAVVNRKTCEKNNKISILDFKGHKSCHGGYSTAAGWNYPLFHIRNSFDTVDTSYDETARKFFSGVCAPSEISGSGVCSGCGEENGTCTYNDLYSGYSGAFRCLVENAGDIAFVKEDTVLLYSKEGALNQSWSTKSVRDFMYLCPLGGCREINGYPSGCTFGTVPGDVIMVHNSIPNPKKLAILETLTNFTSLNANDAQRKSARQLFNPGTQGISIIKEVTRTYLGQSALASESKRGLEPPESQASMSKARGSDNYSTPSIHHFLIVAVVTFAMVLWIPTN